MNYHANRTIAILISATSLLYGCSSSDDDTPDETTTTTTLSITQDNNWTTISRTAVINDIIYAGNKYIAAGKAGYIADSSDGISWTKRESNVSESIDKLVAMGTIVIASVNLSSQIIVSNDSGVTWASSTLSSTDCNNPVKLFHDDTQFVGLFISDQICTSSDGSLWTKASEFIGLNLADATYGGGTYLLASRDGSLQYANSLSTQNWSIPSAIGITGSISDIIYGNDTFLAISNNVIYYSTDNAANWTAATMPFSFASFNQLSYSNAKGFVAYNTTKELYQNIADNNLTSTDGITWTVANAISQPIMSLASGSNEVIAFGITGREFISTDLSTWNEINANQPTDTIVAYATIGQDIYVATYENYEDSNAGPTKRSNILKSSNNGSSWANVYTAENEILDLVANGTELILADKLNIMISADGATTWTNALDIGRLLSASTKIANTLYYVGGDGTILSSDDGINFNSLPAQTTENLTKVASNGTGLVAISAAGSIVHFDGNNWTTPTVTNSGFNDIIWNGSVYVIIGNSGSLFTSDDGIIWDIQNHVHNGNFSQIISNNGLLVTANSQGIATSTDDGVTWIDRPVATTSLTKYLNFDGTNYVGFGDPSNTGNITVITSTDAISWTPDNFIATTPATLNSSISVIGPMFYDQSTSQYIRYVLDNDQALVSTDGRTWSLTTTLPSATPFEFIIANNAIDMNANKDAESIQIDNTDNSYSFGAAFSSDGTNWSLKTDQAFNPGYTPANSVYARLGGNGIETSTDGKDWSTIAPEGLEENSSIITIKYVDGKYVLWLALDHQGSINPSAVYTSNDAINWTRQGLISTDSIIPRYIDFDGTNYLFFVNGDTSNVLMYQSTDLQTFTLQDTGIKEKYSDIEVDSNGYTLIGENGTVSVRSVF